MDGDLWENDLEQTEVSEGGWEVRKKSDGRKKSQSTSVIIGDNLPNTEEQESQRG